ncbi:MAG: HAMP domain-containing protein [Salinibacterium sp.]|nr:HAMP domain-containing protein [Salinibacterium sp.]
MGLTLLVLLVQDVPLSSYLRDVETARIMTSLERDAFVLAGRSEEALETADPGDDAALTQLAQDYRDAGGARVVIVNPDGIAIVTSDDDESKVGASYLSRPEIAGALGGSVETGHRYSTTLGLELLYVTVPVFSGDKILGAVRLTYPEQVVIDTVTRQLGTLGLVALTTVLLSGVVGFIFATGLTRRLTLLRDATELLASGDLKARADEGTGAPEIRALSRSFNSMATRLELLVGQQRSFAADASHQLRTPLTALRLRLERARDLLPDDPDRAAERLADAEAETDRLLSIIEGLLLLNRTEGRALVVHRVDLSTIARERVDQWQSLADELQVELKYEGAPTAPALAVDTAAEQVVDNYLDNALSVSPAGSCVTVRVLPGATMTTLEVSDQGAGLNEVDRVRAFDRFWRENGDRAGSGLGLAIVAQLMTASGGRARLNSRAGGGLTAVAEFPTAPGR